MDVLKPVHNKKAVERTLYNKLNDFPKVHKKYVNGSQPFRPILSAIGTSTYNLASTVFSHLTNPLTSND